MKMNTTKPLLLCCFLACSLGSSRSLAACADARIVSAFRLAVNREPTVTECNANRYAGGAYSSETELIPLVKASLVCSDPWIAQAFFKLSRPLNGHDPTQLESGAPGSTIDQCNYSLYGSWSNFPELMQKVQNRIATSAPAPTGAPLSATIIGPPSLASGQPAMITWSYTGTASTCGSPVELVMNGGGMQNYALARIPTLTLRSFTFQMMDWSRSFPADTPVTLQLVDKCLAKPISSPFSAVITVVKPLQAGMVRVNLQGMDVVLNLAQRILDVDGNVFDANGVIVARGYYLDANRGLRSPSGLVASGGGNLVASGGGNLVASGGGNLVASGGGNLVASGGGNLVASGGGNLADRLVKGLTSDGYLVDSWGVRILPVGSGLRLQANAVLVNAAGTPLVASGGGNIIFNGGVLSVISPNSANLQKLLSGQLTVQALMSMGSNPSGAFNPAAGSINPGVTRQVLSTGTPAPLAPVSISQFFPATATWANGTGLGVFWNYPGIAPSNQMVIVQFQVGGTPYGGCPAVPVSAKTCQIAVTNFSGLLRQTTAVTLTLLDGVTRNVLSTSSVTVRLP